MTGTRIRSARGALWVAAVAALALGPAPGHAQAPPGAPDPTWLPVATTEQTPRTAAYDALDVPALAAGASYRDPTTGVVIHKLTSATFPASGPS